MPIFLPHTLFNQSSRNFRAGKNIYKEFNKSGNKEDTRRKGYPVADMNNVDDNKSTNENSNDNEFIVQSNPLFDDEYVVVHANKNVQGSPKNPFESVPAYIPVEKEKVNDDKAPKLNA